MMPDQPELDFTSGLAPSPAVSRHIRRLRQLGKRCGEDLTESVAQRCRRCWHSLIEHLEAGPCDHPGCDCLQFVRSVEVISLDDFDPRRLARRTDPASSHEAAREAIASGRVRGHEELILRALRMAGEPLTAKEIGRRVGMSNVKVLRRTKAMERRKLIARVPGDGELKFEVAT